MSLRIISCHQLSIQLSSDNHTKTLNEKREKITFLLKAQILSHSMFTTDLDPPWKRCF